MELRRSPRKHVPPPKMNLPCRVTFKADLSKKHRGRPGLRSGQRETPRKVAPFEGLPLDIHYEILLDLEPQDLVNIGRTCQALHAVLYRRSARFIWKGALNRIDAPPSPPDLIEPRYSAFLLGNTCDYCLKKKRQDSLKIMWVSRTRVCRSCANSEQFIQEELCFSTYNNPLYEFAPAVRFISDRSICIHKQEYERLLLQRDSLASEKERESWMEVQKKASKNLMQLRLPVEEWMRHQANKRAEQLRPIRDARLESIQQRINAIAPGLEEEIDIMEMDDDFSLYGIRGLFTPRKLTDKAWNKLKPSVLRCLRKARSTRLDHEMWTQLYEFVEAYEYHVGNHRPPGRLPSAADVATQPEICSLLESHPDDSPCYITAMEDNFTEISSRWPGKLDDELLLVMKKSRPSATLEDLHSPSTTFICSRCDCFLHYPGVLDHHCMTDRRTGGDRLTRVIWKILEQAPWSSDSLVYWPRISALAAKWMDQIDTQIGLEQLLNIPLFECLTCSKEVGTRFVRTWDGMLRAHCPKMKENHLVVQIPLDEKEQVRRKIDIRKLVEKPPLRREKLFVCSSCRCHISASEIWPTTEDGGSDGPHKCLPWKQHAQVTRSGLGCTYDRHPDFVPALAQADLDSVCHS